MRRRSFYQGKSVTSLQTMLRLISAENSRVLPVIPDGYYGANTYGSVRSFQEAFGLPVTGEADQVTWDAIVLAFKNTMAMQEPPIIQPLWSSQRVLESGDQNLHLYLVQAMLTAISQKLPEVSSPSLSGYLDAKTRDGLLWVQSVSDLPQTGNLDNGTWQALSQLYRIVVGNGT